MRLTKDLFRLFIQALSIERCLGYPTHLCQLGLLKRNNEFTRKLYNCIIDLIIFRRFIHKSVETENVEHERSFCLFI